MVSPLLLALLLAAPPEAGSRVLRLPPVDQCAADPSFTAFRDALLVAIARRDRDALLALVADTIEADFGGDPGRDYFASAWQLDRPETSRLWDELGAALRLGCAREPDGEYYYSPSMFLADEGAFEDPFTAAVAIRPGAELRAAPDASSALVAALAWDVVTVPEWDPEAAWQRVALADGRGGYVRSEDLRSPTDYRAVFRRVDGRWRMVMFIAGD
jgi:hypothetical protein